MARSDGVQLLLSGPRGRRLCLSLCGVEVFPLQVDQLSDDIEASGSREPGTSVWWVDALPVTSAWAARIDHALTDGEVFDALADTAAAAMYWEPPDDTDQVLADPMVVDALTPVASAVMASPATWWWDRPIPLADQHFVSWIESRRGTRAAPPALTGSAERLREWRTLTSGPSVSVWWSFPNTVSTSASHRSLPATQLELVEDTMGFDRARVARLEPAEDCRVLELVTPEDWIALVNAYPLDVTRARNDYWPEVTGGRGPWLLPDWSAVSNDFDAVHLTVLAYLASAGRALPCQGGSTVIAGWEPDVTYWLTDSLTQTELPRTWTNPADDHGQPTQWRPAKT